MIAARKQISNDESADRSYCPQLLWDVDDHITLASAGLRSDVQYVADLARRICMEHMYVCIPPPIVHYIYASSFVLKPMTSSLCDYAYLNLNLFACWCIITIMPPPPLTTQVCLGCSYSLPCACYPYCRCGA